MGWDIDIAKELKARNNQNKIGAVIGTVLSIEPLKIGIINNQIIIDKNNAFICSNIINTLIVNDMVLVMATENNQTFIIIDKILEVV